MSNNFFVASSHNAFLNTHMKGSSGGPSQKRRSNTTALLTSHFSLLRPVQPPQLQCAPLSARVPAELLGPAPSSVEADLPAAVVEPSPQSPLHTWPCSTTTLQGLQQQPNLDSRARFEDIGAQGQLEQLPINL